MGKTLIRFLRQKQETISHVEIVVLSKKFKVACVNGLSDARGTSVLLDSTTPALKVAYSNFNITVGDCTKKPITSTTIILLLLSIWNMDIV